MRSGSKRRVKHNLQLDLDGWFICKRRAPSTFYKAQALLSAKQLISSSMYNARSNRRACDMSTRQIDTARASVAEMPKLPLCERPRPHQPMGLYEEDSFGGLTGGIRRIIIILLYHTPGCKVFALPCFPPLALQFNVSFLSFPVFCLSISSHLGPPTNVNLHM